MVKRILFPALLLSIFAFLVVSSMLKHSGTCDEIAHHIPVGYILWEKSDYKMDTSQPPLSRYLVAMPLKLFMKLNLPSDRAAWRAEDRSTFGKDFFFKYNQDPRKIIFLSRLPIVLVGILCGIIIFIWIKFLYGLDAALFGLFLFGLSPEIIAHSGLATTDMTSACFILLSLYSFSLFLKKYDAASLCWTGFALGLAQLSKYTSLILYPLCLGLFVFKISRESVRDKPGKISNFSWLILLSLLTIWVGYGFGFSPLLKGAMRSEEKVALLKGIFHGLPFWSEKFNSWLEYFLFNVPIPFGEHILGIMGVVRHGQLGHGTFFMGRFSGHGSWLYFPLSFAIKTPIPLLIFFFLGICAIIKEKLKGKDIYILVSVLLFFAVASASKLKLGNRYILPIYPLIFIVASKSIVLFKNKRLKLLAVLLSSWYAISAVIIWPNYLSYFNEFIGGPDNGWKYLRDSNIDWGQDLPQLAEYMRKNNLSEITLEYFGQDKPEVYGIKWLPLPEEEKASPQRKVYAISANLIDGTAWAEKIKPTTKAGKSIFIYDLRKIEKN